MSPKKRFWLIQAPNMSKHISRNRGATIKISRKTAYDKVEFFWGGRGEAKHGSTIKTFLQV